MNSLLTLMNAMLTFVGKLLLLWFKVAAVIVLGFVALIFALTWNPGR